MTARPALLPPPVGLETISGRARLPRHRHDEGYVALVLAGGYRESGDSGRFEVGPGDALVHAPFEAHCDEVSSEGAVVLNLPRPAALAEMVRCRVADPDAVLELASRNPSEAVEMLASTADPCHRMHNDWPDMLARRLRDLAPFHMAEWADLQGLAPESVSRGFARAYGVTPHLYRAEARGRKAVAAIRAGRKSLAEIALDLGFSDQPHMTRSVRSLTGRSPSQLRPPPWRRRA